jgi:hypothetical protein
MAEFNGVYNEGRPYVPIDPENSSPIQLTGRALHIPSPYGDHGDYPIGYMPQESEDVDPPFSSTHHQKAMAAMMEIMSLIITIGCSLRGALRNAKKAASLEQIGKLLDAADKLRDAAVCALVAGVVEGAMSIAGGCLEIQGALKGMSEMKKTITGIDWEKFADNSAYAGKMTKKLTGQIDGVVQKLNTIKDSNLILRNTGAEADYTAAIKAKKDSQLEIDQNIIAFAQRSNQRMDQIAMFYRAASQLCQALASIGRGSAQFSEKRAEADGQELQAEATQHEFEKDQWADLKKEIDEMVGTILSVIKSIYSSDNQTVTSILR